MSYKQRSYTLDWWVIKKRQIYLLLLLVLALVGVGVGLVYTSRNGLPFGDAALRRNAKNGARFVFFEGDVRIMRGTTRETLQASSQTEVFPGDTLQTQSDGRARLTMADGATLLVRENSTVLIRDNAGEAGTNANVKVAVDRGQINVRTSENNTGARNIVETPKTENALAAKTNTSFGVNADQSEEIRVNGGRLQTTTRDGTKTTLEAGEYLAVNATGAIARREHLLEPPKLLSPVNGTQFIAPAKGFTPVPLRWSRTNTAVSYRLEIAFSPFFVQPGLALARDKIAAAEMVVNDLSTGTYFWRVQAAAASGQVSEWSDADKFVMAPPAATNARATLSDMNAALVGGRIYLLTGRARPGTTVRCLGRSTLATRDQSWQLQVTVPGGVRSVRVVAQEAQGPTSEYDVKINVR